MVYLEKSLDKFQGKYTQEVVEESLVGLPEEISNGFLEKSPKEALVKFLEKYPEIFRNFSENF